MIVDPKLLHNRKADARWARMKWQVFGGSVLLMMLLVFLLPSSAVEPTVMVLLVATGVVFGFLEFKRFQIFRRDLRERGD